MVAVRTLLDGVDVVQPSSVEIPINSVTADSRHVWPGSAFVAVEGYIVNGLDYVQNAIAHGAALIISNGGTKADDLLDNVKTPTVRVKNVRKALSAIAANLHGHPSEKLTTVGITGTNGKTTTGYIIDSILKAADIKSGMMGTLGVAAPGMEAHTGLTTPDSLDLQRTLALFVDGGLTHSVIEVSSHALELDRVADVSFDMAVFTNFSQDHLDFHKSMDNYFQAKSRLFAMLSSDKCAVLNTDDPKSAELEKVTDARVITYAMEADADVIFSDWGMSIDGISGTVETGGETIHISSPLMGSYNLHNILAAVATATVLEVPVDAIESGVQSLVTVPGRVERMKSHNGAIVIVDYAHT
ncbi:MAG TPA: UDP-N-acetylmuramyl-tripeptide synthetase, partial [Candidatus Marinimicrobia bacterium]|nr:UDP-N-acetylmuramyl-tripeptide synthetase [Candidatus Neomarinimicrobiota bacterium]